MTAPADLIISAGRVHLPVAERAALAAPGRSGTPPTTVAVRGSKIVAVGTREDVQELIGPATRLVESPNGLLTPGFQDSHVHTPVAGRNLLQVWLNDTTGRQNYLDAIKTYADTHPEVPWILGGGWAMEYFPGGTPTKEDLDAIVPDRPVFLFNRDVHGAWVNSRTLEIAGITKDTSDPVDGRIERHPETGEPTGTLHEGAAYTLNERFVPTPDLQGWIDGLLAGQAHLHRLGITGWQDAWITPQTFEAYRALALDGRLTGRAVGALWWDRAQGLEQIPQFLSQREAGAGLRNFHPTSVKIMTDGVLENFTGALLEPYCDGCGGHTDNHGIAFVERDLLAAAVTALDGHGFQVHMHAIGDRAVRNALDAVAAARATHGMNDLRHHIAHIQIIQPDDVHRFAELGVVANCQAYWAQMEPQMEELTLPFIGKDRAQMQYVFASLLRSGAHLAMGSDWSVTTANPLEQIEVAVNRADPSTRDASPFLPEEALALEVALDAFTAGSAYVNHDGDGGRIAVGARADLALLDVDVLAPGYLTGGRGPIADATVQLTVAGGIIVHEPTPS
jgi:hypothetical protein